MSRLIKKISQISRTIRSRIMEKLLDLNAKIAKQEGKLLVFSLWRQKSLIL